MSQISAMAFKKKNWGAIAFTILFPTILTYLYFIALKNHSPETQQITYGIGKTVQFGFPGLFFIFVLKERLQFKIPSAKELFLGFAFGLAVFFVCAIGYQFVLSSSTLLLSVKPAIMQKISELNLTGLSAYIWIALFYSIIHSLLEEYYWRWFVYGQINKLSNKKNGIIISSIGFMLHHVLVVGVYFGFSSPLTYVLSVSVAVGGAFWAWLYGRYNSLYGVWLSHAIVDLAIFYIGYRIIYT